MSDVARLPGQHQNGSRLSRRAGSAPRHRRARAGGDRPAWVPPHLGARHLARRLVHRHHRHGPGRRRTPLLRHHPRRRWKVARQYGRQVLTGSSERTPAGGARAGPGVLRPPGGRMLVCAGMQHGNLVRKMRAGMPVVFLGPAGQRRRRGHRAGGPTSAHRLAVRHLAAHGHNPHRFPRRRSGTSSPPTSDCAASARAACAPASATTRTWWPNGPARRAGHRRGAAAGSASTGSRHRRRHRQHRITVTCYACWPATQPPALVGFDDFELADLIDRRVTVSRTTRGLSQGPAELLFSRLTGDTSADGRSAGGVPSRRENSSSAAALPIALASCAITVTGGSIRSASSKSSKPTRAGRLGLPASTRNRCTVSGCCR